MHVPVLDGRENLWIYLTCKGGFSYKLNSNSNTGLISLHQWWDEIRWEIVAEETLTEVMQKSVMTLSRQIFACDPLLQLQHVSKATSWNHKLRFFKFQFSLHYLALDDIPSSLAFLFGFSLKMAFVRSHWLSYIAIQQAISIPYGQY